MAAPRESTSTARRRDHFSSPRTSFSRPGSSIQARPSYQGYREPDAFWNLDEGAVSPPVSELEHPQHQGRQASLEDSLRHGKTEASEGSQIVTRTRTPSRHERNVSYQEGRSTLDDPYELTEVNGPRPVLDESSDDDRQGRLEQRYDIEGSRERRVDAQASSEEDAPYRPRTPAEYMNANTTVSIQETPKWLSELYAVSYLIFFAIWGTLARLGVQWLTFYPGTPIVTPVIWANFAGSLIMGFLAEDQGLFRAASHTDSTNGDTANGHKPRELSDSQATESKAAHTKRKKTIPLYIGLATGFCGSFTSFSSFARDYFLALSNDLPIPINHPIPNPTTSTIQSTLPRNGGYSFQACVHIILATLALSLGGLITGAQIAAFLAHRTPPIHGRFVQKILDPAVVFLAWGSWLGAVLMAIFPPSKYWRGEVLFAIVFAPLGCLLRFYLSLKLNALVPSFPLGTFAANMLGAAIEGMGFDVQHVRVGVMGRVGGGRTGCQVLQGVLDGFCAALTTVSTWVAEINGLERRHGWTYGGVSVVSGLGIMVVVMGSVRWSVGWQEPVCATNYFGKVGG